MELLRKKLASALYELFGEQLTGTNFDAKKITITPAPEAQSADFASNVAFLIAKIAGVPPREIAEKIAERLQNDPDFRVEVAGAGFLNFFLSDTALNKIITENGQLSAVNNLSAGKTIVCEFSDPNPFKVLHVGHFYTSVVGEAIAKLFETAGAKVIRANFGGDVGLHVAKNLYAQQKHLDEFAALKQPATTGGARADFLSRCYVEGTKAYETDANARAEITKLNAEIYAIAEQGQPDADKDPQKQPRAAAPAGQTAPVSPSPENKNSQTSATEITPNSLADLYRTGRAWSYDAFTRFYAKIGVKFDRYYPESAVAGLGKAAVLQGLEQGIFTTSAGAVVFPGEKYGLHTRVFINRDGLPTYETKDVGLSLQKWQDYHFDQSVIITGNDITEYMKVVTKAISLLAPEPAERTLHLTHGNVKLAGGTKMSSRRGNFLKADEVFRIVQNAIAEEYGSENPRITLAAIKYAFLKNKLGADLIFDPKESVSKSGNSGPYLQYSVLRAQKICEKSGQETGTDDETQDFEQLKINPNVQTFEQNEPKINPGFQNSGKNKPKTVAKAPDGNGSNPASENSSYQFDRFEHELIVQFASWPSVLAEAVTELAPHKICTYLYSLAQTFNRFYEHDAVIGDAQEDKRLRIVRRFLAISQSALKILGIEVPEKM